MASATIPRSLLDEYNAAIKAAGGDAASAAREVMASWLETNPEATVAEAREYAKVLLASAGEVFGARAEERARRILEIVASMGGEDVDLDEGWHYVPDEAAIDRAVRYQAGKLAEGRTQEFVDAIAETARYVTERGANGAMISLGLAQGRTARRRSRGGRRSPREGIRFARVPTGAETCEFCIMLASRGFVYLDEKTAGEMSHFHTNCDCRIVPGYPGMTVEGYDPDYYYDAYKHPENHPEIRDAINTRRRELRTERRKTSSYEEESARWSSEKKEQRRRDVRVAIQSTKAMFISPNPRDRDLTESNRRLINNISRIKPQAGMYDVHAHGGGRTVEVFNSDVSAETLAYIIRSRDDYHGEPIRLFSCEAGRPDSSGYVFARELADILGVTVHAAPDVTKIKVDGSFYFGDTEDSSFIIFKPREGKNADSD